MVNCVVNNIQDNPGFSFNPYPWYNGNATAAMVTAPRQSMPPGRIGEPNMAREISTLNRKIDDLRNLMEVVLDANQFTQPVTTQQTHAVSVGSNNALSQLNAEVTELRHIMEVILDANRFSQSSTSHQTITSSGTSEFSRLNDEVNELRNLMEAFLETQAGSGANSGRTNGTRELDTAASSNHCVVCRDEVSNSVIYNCGHMCICQACGIQLKNRNSTCPVCRTPIRDIIRVYRN
nr:E3 ubiquitin-protein ligase NEURL1-like isoform X2 [Crassostrea virginica]XP_022344500.1 E3 ubiquitin-protein ligase NEURL1-like isoform X2 [Crassostrea virginica]